MREWLKRVLIALFCFSLYLYSVWCFAGRIIAIDTLSDERRKYENHLSQIHQESVMGDRWEAIAERYTITLSLPSKPLHSMFRYIYPIHSSDFVKLSSPYGERNPQEIGGYGDHFHNGVDMWGISHISTWQARVVSVASGKVVRCGWENAALGYSVYVEHDDGNASLYGHLSAIYVDKGDHVKGGEVLGRQGSTGYTNRAHLHFALYIDGKEVNPLHYISGGYLY